MKKEELLDRYYKGELSSDEINSFIEQGVISKSDIESLGLLTSALAKKDDENMRAFLNNLDVPNKSSRSKKGILYIVLGVAIAILLIGYFLLKKTTKTTQNIDVTQYAFLYPSDENSRSSDDESVTKNEILTQAEMYYSKSEYQRFINYYKENKDIFSQIESSQLQYISALIALKKYDKVLTEQKDIACKSTECSQNLEWYKMISLIGSNQMDEAIPMLRSIQKNIDHIFYSDSKKLLDELNN